MKEAQNISNRLDELEATMIANFPHVDRPVNHTFVEGYYIRTIVMKKDLLITSMVHDTQHAFHVAKGSVYVKINEDEWDYIEAPFWGITEPGTRRVLLIDEECTWSTFHKIKNDELPVSGSKEDVELAVGKICSRIIVPHENEYLGGVLKNNHIVKEIETYVQE